MSASIWSPVKDSGTYLGEWNASTNSPLIVSQQGNINDFYQVAVAGTSSIDGIASWAIGDYIWFNGTVWTKVDNKNVTQADLALPEASADIGFSWSTPTADRVNWGINTAADGVNVMRYIPVAEWAAMFTGTSTYDTRAAWLAAKAVAVAEGKALYAPTAKKMYVSASLDLTGVRAIDCRANIQVASGSTITVGGLLGPVDIRFRDVTDGTSVIVGTPPVNPIVRLTGSANGRFEIGACNHLQFYADAAVTNNRLCAYNTAFLNGPVNLLSLTDSGVAQSYVNENLFYSGRLNKLRITGVAYGHNHNKFYSQTFEEALVEITITGTGVSCNDIVGARFEGVASAPGVTFGAGTYSNKVIGTWSGVGDPRNQFIRPGGLAVSDSGMGNLVASQSLIDFTTTPITSIGADTPLVANGTESASTDPCVSTINAGIDNLTDVANITPGLVKVVPTAGNRFVSLSPPIPVGLGDVITFDAEYTGTMIRTLIYVLDENQRPILSEGVGGAYVSQNSTAFNATYGRYGQSSDLSAADLKISPVAIIRPEVKFIRIGLFVGVASPITHLSAAIHTQCVNRAKTQAAALQKSQMYALAGAPTQGYLPYRSAILNRSTNAVRSVTFAHETLLNGALSAGATSATVDAISTVANGDIVGLLMDDLTTHWSVVASLSGSTFAITAVPVGRSIPDNARVTFMRVA